MMFHRVLVTAFFAEAAGVAIPTPAQLAYQDLEVGTLIHFNAQTLCTNAANHSTNRCEKAGRMPTDDELRAWNPAQLDTDQWLSAAVSFGARYAVLVVDHFSGFNLWPSAQNNYSISMTSWRDGKGDVLADFVKSCQKFDVRPGIFYSVHNNWNQHVSGHTVHSGTREEFNEFVDAQMQELLGGTYGDLLGVWFDNGVWSDKMPELMPLVRTLQPEALCHSCTNGTQDPSDPKKGYGLRWCGDEQGSMPLPNWYATNSSGSFHQQVVHANPHGEIYNPAETDTVLREHYWFWMNGTESAIKPTKRLVSNYFTSVGHGSNLILAMAPDNTGAVPTADMDAYAKFGQAVKCLFSKPLATVTSFNSSGMSSEFQMSSPIPAETPLILSLQEDLVNGQLVDTWTVEWLLPSGWNVALKGQSLGHRRLLGGADKFVTPKSASVSAFRINVTSLDATLNAPQPRLAAAVVFEKPMDCYNASEHTEILV
jgi:alpha-L-fucosidase